MTPVFAERVREVSILPMVWPVMQAQALAAQHVSMDIPPATKEQQETMPLYAPSVPQATSLRRLHQMATLAAPTRVVWHVRKASLVQSLALARACLAVKATPLQSLQVQLRHHVVFACQGTLVAQPHALLV